MCIPLIAVGVTIATAAASMAAQASAQKNAANAASKTAHDQNDAAIKQSGAEYTNQENTMKWQDTTWQQDVDFATQTLSYQGKEFAKQADYVAAAGTAIITNENAGFAQEALKSVQQNIALTLQETNVNSSAAEKRASAQAAADGRGAAGNTVNSIVDDVSRQQGQAVSVMEMNRDAGNNQARLDLEAQKAASDTQLGQLEGSVKSFSPSTPIRAPGPVGTVQSPTLVSAAPRSALGDALAIGAAGLSGATTGLSAYNSVAGQTTHQTATSIGDLLGIK